MAAARIDTIRLSFAIVRTCWQVQRYTRCGAAFLLFKANEMLGAILLTGVNLAYYKDMMAGMRAAIAAGAFERFRAQIIDNHMKSQQEET
jgi:tRNA-guanine family transglycosylase